MEVYNPNEDFIIECGVEQIFFMIILGMVGV